MSKHYLCCTDLLCNSSCQFYRYLELLRSELKKKNYRCSTIQCYSRCTEHFFYWSNSPENKLAVINESTIERFFEHLSNCSCWYRAPIHCISIRAALNWLLKVLRKHKEIPAKFIPASHVDNEVRLFKDYLTKVCGVSKDTLIYRLRYAKEFLTAIYGENEVDPNILDPYIVLDYVSSRVKNCSRGTAKVITVSLRSYFKFLNLFKRIKSNLAGALPVIPIWKLSSLPNVLSTEDIEKVLSSFDRSSKSGMRDYAITLCFAELGLRTCEISELSIDDINWKTSHVVVHAQKSRRERTLPLLSRTGEAIAAYLYEGRPTSDFRKLFLRHRGALGSPVSRPIVRGVVRRRFEKLFLSSNFTPHMFRHSLAGKLLKNGSNIKQIADILGHKTIETTMIYTKIDLQQLSKVTMKWLEVAK